MRRTRTERKRKERKIKRKKKLDQKKVICTERRFLSEIISGFTMKKMKKYI